MTGQSFQWFVAWRYLLERPNRLSGAILFALALAIWVAGGLGAALRWFPLTDALYVPAPNVPVWLPIVFGLALAGVVTGLVGAAAAAVLHPGRGRGGWRSWGERLPTSTLVLTAYAGLIALAAIGVYGWLLGADLIEAERLRARLEQPAILVAIVAGVALVPVSIVAHRWWRGLFSAWVGGIVALVSVVAAVPAGAGLAQVVAPELADGGAGALALPGLGLALLVAGALLAIGRDRRRLGLHLALVGFAWAAVAVSVPVWESVSGMVEENLAFIGGFVQVKLPMALVIPLGIAAALVPLIVILLVIRYFFTFFTTVSIGGVAIGSMALVVVLSVMSGFENDLREKILGSNAHIQVSRTGEVGFQNYRELMERIAEAPGVRAQTPYLLSEVVIAANNNYSNSIIKGIDPRTIGAVTDLDEDLEEEGALEKLWPLAKDGSVLGPPAAVPEAPPAAAPEGDVVDPAPGDLVLPPEEAPDFSAGVTELPPPAAATDAVDPAPDDLVLPPEDVLDFSGGATEVPDAPAFDRDEAPIVQDDPDLGEGEGEGEGEGWARPIDDDFDFDSDIRDYIPPQVATLPGVLVGRELVKNINLYPGQEVRIISPLGQDTPLGPVPRTKPLRVAGVFYTGMYEYDLKFLYVELGTLQDFLDLGDEVNGIEISVGDPERTDRTVAALRASLGDDYQVQDWKDLNRSLFSALKLEKIAMFLVLVIIILVASFSIVGNLIMVVVEKAKEIAILKTLGASNRGIMKIFVVQGFFIGLVGTSIGVSLGLVICWALMRFGLPLDPDVYYIDRLPIHLEPLSVVAVGVAGMLISVVATIYPAFVAAGVRPVKGLRSE